MKKFIICILMALAIATSMVFDTVVENDPVRKNEEEFGTIWYGTTDASVRVRHMDTKDEYYQVYLCWYSQDGTVENYQKMDICSKDELVESVGNAIRFYENSRE